MATYTSGAINEVLVGTGVLYVADRAASGLAYPGDDGSGNWQAVSTASAAWRDIGYSEDGWTLEMDRTFEDILVAEEIDPIKTIKTAQEARLMGELSQASLANLSVAMGQIDSYVSEDDSDFAAGYDVVKAPITDSFSEMAALLIAEGPAGADRHVQMPRVVSVGAFSMQHAKAPQKVVIATEFKLLVPDSTFNVGATGGKNHLFKIVDNTNDSQTFDVN
tara:strand:+ start:531 stop:1190 length:660 start_codon:yes stop_codon:yes gene_type:complete